jgi:large subunit ribosomal protein L25
MMEKVVLKATPRNVTGRHVRALRRSGQLPAVIYGHHVDLEGKEYPSLVREKQLNYIKRTLIHADFLVVSLTEKIRANVAIQLTGSSPAVKDLNAMLINGLTELEVEAFPQDLPDHFEVDIASLVKIGDAIHVKDIVMSDKVQVLDSPDEMIVLATAPAKEEVVEVVTPEAEVVAEGTEPEIIEKGKKEEEAAAEEKK